MHFSIPDTQEFQDPTNNSSKFTVRQLGQKSFCFFFSTNIWQSLQFRLWNYSAALQCYCIIMVLHYQKPLALVEAHNFEQQQQEHFFQQLRTGVFFYIWPAQWLGLYFYQIWFMQSYFLNLIIRNFLGF